MTDPSDTELEQIDEEECWQLLGSRPVGRVAVVVGHYPQVFPVNHAVDGRRVFFRTAPGTKLWAIHRSNVTLEVDDIDASARVGWSVMLRGSAREISTDRHRDRAERASAAGAQPWAPGARTHLVEIAADQISGRRIRCGELAAQEDRRG